MNKTTSFKVLNSRGQTVVVEANEIHFRGEYVEFYEPVGGVPPHDEIERVTDEPGVMSRVVTVMTLPSRRLLTVMHRPQEITPVWE